MLRPRCEAGAGAGWSRGEGSRPGSAPVPGPQRTRCFMQATFLGGKRPFPIIKCLSGAGEGLEMLGSISPCSLELVGIRHRGTAGWKRREIRHLPADAIKPQDLLLIKVPPRGIGRKWKTNGLHPSTGCGWAKRCPALPCHPAVAQIPPAEGVSRGWRQQDPTAGARARSGCQRLGMRRVALTFCRPQTFILHLAKIQTWLVTLLACEGSGARKGFAPPDRARVASGTPQGSPPLVPSGDRAGAQR